MHFVSTTCIPQRASACMFVCLCLCVFPCNDNNIYQACFSVQDWVMVFKIISLCLNLPAAKLPKAKAANTDSADF